MHEVPHAVASVSLAHLAPHLWKPMLHEKPQVPLAHVAAWAFAGNGHGAQLDAPHALMSLTLGHEPPHRCVLAGQVPEHGAAAVDARAEAQRLLRGTGASRTGRCRRSPCRRWSAPCRVNKDAPHVCGLVLSAHPCGHMCWVLEHDGAASTTEPSLGPGPSPGPEPSLSEQGRRCRRGRSRLRRGGSIQRRPTILRRHSGDGTFLSVKSTSAPRARPLVWRRTAADLAVRIGEATAPRRAPTRRRRIRSRAAFARNATRASKRPLVDEPRGPAHRQERDAGTPLSVLCGPRASRGRRARRRRTAPTPPPMSKPAPTRRSLRAPVVPSSRVVRGVVRRSRSRSCRAWRSRRRKELRREPRPRRPRRRRGKCPATRSPRPAPAIARCCWRWRARRRPAAQARSTGVGASTGIGVSGEPPVSGPFAPPRWRPADGLRLSAAPRRGCGDRRAGRDPRHGLPGWPRRRVPDGARGARRQARELDAREVALGRREVLLEERTEVGSIHASFARSASPRCAAAARKFWSASSARPSCAAVRGVGADLVGASGAASARAS